MLPQPQTCLPHEHSSAASHHPQHGPDSAQLECSIAIVGQVPDGHDRDVGSSRLPCVLSSPNLCPSTSPPVSRAACVPDSDQSVTRRHVEVLRQPSTHLSSQVICVCSCRITLAYRSHVQPSLFSHRGVTAGFMRCTISTSQPAGTACGTAWHAPWCLSACI